MPRHYNDLRNMQLPMRSNSQQRSNFDRQQGNSLMNSIPPNTSNQPALDPRGALNPNYQEPDLMRMKSNEQQRAMFNQQQQIANDALIEAMGAQGISSTPWEVALSAGGPPTQTGNPWSGGQMERLRRLEPQDRQQLLEALARESAPAVSPQEMQQQSRSRNPFSNWQMHGGGNPFATPTNEEMEKYKIQQRNHPLNRFRNFIQNKMDQLRR